MNGWEETVIGSFGNCPNCSIECCFDGKYILGTYRDVMICIYRGMGG